MFSLEVKVFIDMTEAIWEIECDFQLLSSKDDNSKLEQLCFMSVIQDNDQKPAVILPWLLNMDIDTRIVPKLTVISHHTSDCHFIH